MIRLKIAKKMKISTKFIYFFNRLLNKFFKLNILDTNSSIDLLLDTNVSLARYGDGELNIMMGGDIHFQKYHPEFCFIFFASSLRSSLLSNPIILFIPKDCKFLTLLFPIEPKPITKNLILNSIHISLYFQ